MNYAVQNSAKMNNTEGFSTQFMPHRETGFFSKIVLDYVERKESIQPFVKGYFEKDTVLKKVAACKKQYGADRVKLAELLSQQYDGIEVSAATQANLESIKSENTFTITTGHQLNLFTGPLYYFYKIIHVINLCESLNKTYPTFHFVPIFWMNTEDHDFEEVNHFHLYGQTHSWTTEQIGAVGNFETASLKPVIEELEERLGNSENAQSIVAAFKDHYLKHKSYRKAVLSMANWLFGKYGLVIMDQHNAGFKSMLFPFLENELTQHQLYSHLKETKPQLEAAGYHEQAMPRAINLFYLDEKNQRNRIVYEDEMYKVLNTNLTFTEESILVELHKNPIRFSTNVLSRPIYQQTVLPNLAYVGGGGELAYWMQLKSSFEALDAFFPDLILRNSVLIVDSKSQKKMGKLNLGAEAMFTKQDQLIKNFVQANTESDLSLAEEKKQLESLFESIIAKALKVDQTLEKSATGEMKKQLNSIEKLESKILRAEKRNFEQFTSQITTVQNKLFPNGKLQERYENFLGFWMDYGSDFVDQLKANLDPWKEEFTVLLEEK